MTRHRPGKPIAVGTLKKPAPPTVGRSISKDTRKGIAHVPWLASRMKRPRAEGKGWLDGKGPRILD
ncbi:hypothetical protein, partial [Komagataeibacter intermedius]|uniref:hypothetical protein n=1 Tax=Komagataeibacter intermedius TaxID=66229 RepID=UPI001ADFEA8F